VMTCREALTGSAQKVKRPRQARPTTSGDHHAEVPPPQALPRRPGAAPSRAPDRPVGSAATKFSPCRTMAASTRGTRARDALQEALLERCGCGPSTRRATRGASMADDGRDPAARRRPPRRGRPSPPRRADVLRAAAGLHRGGRRSWSCGSDPAGTPSSPSGDRCPPGAAAAGRCSGPEWVTET
jgi:hypothetical protein